MGRLRLVVMPIIAILFLAVPWLASAQVTLVPNKQSVTLGQSVQFSATGTGVSNPYLTWWVNGQQGGNPSYGRISAQGLYTAPTALPAKNPFYVTVIYQTSSGVKVASSSVTLLNGPPVITTVTPNPLVVGTDNLTVNGTGFLQGAVIQQTTAAGTASLATTFNSSYALQATVTETAVQTVTFVVVNPDGQTSGPCKVQVNANQAYPLTVINGTGSGNYQAGTPVTVTTNPPAGSTFVNWSGATFQNPNALSTSFTMPNGPTTVTANYTLNATIPYPVSSHPRLWVTQNDELKLQAWAVPSNPVYNAMQALLGTCVGNYNNAFFPGGQPNPNYPDAGDTQGYGLITTEPNALVLAFNSLIDPSATNRITYAQMARNLLMYAMNQAVQGPLAGAPFRDPQFPTYNRSRATGEKWPLIVDWLYCAKDANGINILTAQDKATIRNVFLLWCSECNNVNTAGQNWPGGTTNTNLLPGGQPYRYASNNYYLGHARDVTMMALCMDPSDDPPINPNLSAATLGNTLRSYILNATGSWLYQEYAMMGEPSQVPADYGLQSQGGTFGIASGGLPPEGEFYGESYGSILGQLLALQTAGFNNQVYSGPQIKLIGAPVWDRYVTGMMSSLTPSPVTPPNELYLGPIYQLANYGDTLRIYPSPDYMQPFALLSLLEGEQGQTTHLNAARWFTLDAVLGTQQNYLHNISDPWTWGVDDSILAYMMLDPSMPVSSATDPRPTFPLAFFDPAAGRVLAHSDWGPNNTMFDYRASWITINHQNGDGGQFELYRNGEWLTKEMSNYDNNGVGQTTYFHNTLGLQNWCANGTPDLQWFEGGLWANGSQWMEGMNAGDPSTISSNGTGYAYASSNLTNLYNRPDSSPSNAAMDITQATRSILWLNNDYIVVYDRATSVHPGLFKRFNLSLTTNPTINGNVATETMADGQNLFVQSLLPANASITSVYAAGKLNPIADTEPTQYVMMIQDPTLPSDTRFLTVLQGANSGVAMTPATRLTSATGTPFDGAMFGANAVFFPVSVGAITTTSFTVPSTVTTLIITGLTPGATYGVSEVTGANGKTITLTPGGAGSIADSGGLLKMGV
jgi:hypothetical protein